MANVHTMAGPDYSAWHYAPDTPVRLTAGHEDTVDLQILVGVWSAAPTGETITVRWSVADGAEPGHESVVSAADVAPIDDAFEASLRTVDDAPVSGPTRTFQEETRRFQADLVKRVLEANSWNVSAAARDLDLTRAHLYNLINAFNLKR